MNRQPLQTVRIGIDVDGCTVASGASMTVTGDAGTEVVQINDNARFLGALFFSSISGVTIGGLSTGFIDIKAINSMGQPVIQDYVVNESMPCRFFMHEGKLKLRPAGQMESGQVVMMEEPGADVNAGDIVTCLTGLESITVTRVVHHEHFYDFTGAIHHSEAHLNNIQ